MSSSLEEEDGAGDELNGDVSVEGKRRPTWRADSASDRRKSSGVRLRPRIEKLESMDDSLLSDMDSATVGYVREFAYTSDLKESTVLELLKLTLYPIVWLLPCILIVADSLNNFWTAKGIIYNVFAVSAAACPVFLSTPVLFSWQCGMNFMSLRRLLVCGLSGIFTFQGVNFGLTYITGVTPLPFASFVCGIPACGPVLAYMYIGTPKEALRQKSFRARILWCFVLYGLMMMATIFHMALGVLFFSNADKTWQPLVGFCFLPLKVVVKKIGEILVYKKLDGDTAPAMLTFFEHLHAFYQATIMTRASITSLVFLIFQDAAINTFYMIRLTGLVDQFAHSLKGRLFSSWCWRKCKRDAGDEEEVEEEVHVPSDAKLNILGKSRFKRSMKQKSKAAVEPEENAGSTKRRIRRKGFRVTSTGAHELRNARDYARNSFKIGGRDIAERRKSMDQFEGIYTPTRATCIAFYRVQFIVMNELIDFIAPVQYFIITMLIRWTSSYNRFSFVLFENHWNPNGKGQALSDTEYLQSLVWIISGAFAELLLFFIWRRVIFRMIHLDILDVLRFLLRKTFRKMALLHSFTIAGVMCLVLTSGGCDLTFTFGWLSNNTTTLTNITNYTGN